MISVTLLFPYRVPVDIFALIEGDKRNYIMKIEVI